VRHPLLELVLALRFHDLKAALELEVDPARDVGQALGREAATVSEPPVDRCGLPGPEVLDHHEAHAALLLAHVLVDLRDVRIAHCRSRFAPGCALPSRGQAHLRSRSLSSKGALVVRSRTPPESSAS